MKLNYVIIYVDDAVKATEFYQKAFGLKTKFIHESNMYADMESGETTLAFANNEMLKMNTGIEPLPLSLRASPHFRLRYRYDGNVINAQTVIGNLSCFLNQWSRYE